MANEIAVRPGDPDVDLWLDDGFAGLDTRRGAGQGDNFGNTLVRDFATPEEVARIEAAEAAQPAAEVISNVPLPAAPAPIRSENEQPNVYEFEDGSSAKVEPHKGGGLKATISLGAGSGAEVFYGKDREELFRALLIGKLNASKKIREQNRQLKTQVPGQRQAAPKASPKPAIRELTADEKFSIKTQLEADPDLALQDWFQKKTGMTMDKLVELAGEGRTAKQEIAMREEIAAFNEEHPRLLPGDPNFTTIMGCLTKLQLNKEYPSNPAEAEKIWDILLENNLFNRTTLAEAYDSLVQDGLLELVPEEAAPPVEEPPAPPAPVPAGIPTAPRPKAASIAFGVRPSNATATPESSTVPTAEELDKLPTDQINELMHQVRQSRAAARRNR